MVTCTEMASAEPKRSGASHTHTCQQTSQHLPILVVQHSNAAADCCRHSQNVAVVVVAVVIVAVFPRTEWPE